MKFIRERTVDAPLFEPSRMHLRMMMISIFLRKLMDSAAHVNALSNSPLVYVYFDRLMHHPINGSSYCLNSFEKRADVTPFLHYW